MKSLMLMTTLLFSMNSFANHVGDRIQMKVSVNGQHAANVNWEITQQTAQGYTRIETITYTDGRAGEQSNTIIREQDMWTHQTGQMIIAYCESFAGTVEAFTDANGTSHNACKMPLDNKAFAPMIEKLGISTAGYGWAGDFPITGLGKIESEGQTFLLTNYHWAN